MTVRSQLAQYIPLTFSTTSCVSVAAPTGRDALGLAAARVLSALASARRGAVSHAMATAARTNAVAAPTSAARRGTGRGRRRSDRSGEAGRWDVVIVGSRDRRRARVIMKNTLSSGVEGRGMSASARDPEPVVGYRVIVMGSRMGTARRASVDAEKTRRIGPRGGRLDFGDGAMATMAANTKLRTGAMLAGDVAKALGIGIQTLHYYEREGLIPPPERTDAGYRLYTPALVERVGFIRKAQALGLPLGEIREVLQLAEGGGCPCGRVRSALQERLREVDRRLRELRSFRRELAALIDRSGELSARRDEAHVCAIVERAVPLPAWRPVHLSRDVVLPAQSPRRRPHRRCPL